MDDIYLISKRRCVIALVVCTLIVSVSFFGVTKKIVSPLASDNPVTGVESFRYFTVLSNVFMNVCTILCIPYQIDGIFKQNYHLPRWIVDFLYYGVTCTTITFLISLLAIAPFQGFKETFLIGSLPYLHFVCPVLALILFLVINVDHTIKSDRIFFATIPVLLYMVVYSINVFILSEEKGGWYDHYYIKGNFPIGLSLLAVFIEGLSVAYLLRELHNKQHKKFKNMLEHYYLNDYDKGNINIIETIKKIGHNDQKKYKEGDIVIPVHIIKVLKELDPNISDDKLYKAYIDAFFSHE